MYYVPSELEVSHSRGDRGLNSYYTDKAAVVVRHMSGWYFEVLSVSSPEGSQTKSALSPD